MKVRVTLTFEYDVNPSDYDLEEGERLTIAKVREYDEAYITSGEALEFNDVTFTLEEVKA